MEESLKQFVERMKDQYGGVSAFDWLVNRDDMSRLIALAELKLMDETHCLIDELPSDTGVGGG